MLLGEQDDDVITGELKEMFESIEMLFVCDEETLPDYQ